MSVLVVTMPDAEISAGMHDAKCYKEQDQMSICEHSSRGGAEEAS